MKGKNILLIVILVLASSACAAEPETIIETVIHEATIEVLQTVEVTRQVEVPVDVTRQVEVTKEVPVEVTRIVEIVITATPQPTPEPTPEPAPTNTPAVVEAAQPAAEALPPPSSDVTVLLLQASRALHEQMLNFRDHGMGAGNCYVIVENQDNFLAAPTFDLSGASPEARTAYNHYLSAVELAKDAALGISQGCRDAIANQSSFQITGLNYNDIRDKLERGLAELDQGINILEPLSAE